MKEDDGLIRDFGLLKATALNMSNMVGIGPFITMHLIIGAMGGPQAMLGWIVGVVLAICDGMVWSELSAAMPGSGGTYVYLRECFGRERWGRLLAFLFIWQFIFSGPLEIASGAIGLSNYAKYLFEYQSWWSDWHQKAIAAGVSILTVGLLYRRITAIGTLMLGLWLTMLATVLFVIVSGVLHFDSSLIFPFPEGALGLDRRTFLGLGMALGYAMYDYLGYYDVCYVGDEVIHPEKNIPRSVLISVCAVAAIYMTMNISFIGVIPWREISDHVGTDFIERLYGTPAACVFAVFIIVTALASMLALLLGYSRIPYAAARDGAFLPFFDHLHPIQQFPDRSLLVIGLVTVITSFWDLSTVIEAILTCRILVQFIGQNAGLMVYHRRAGGQRLPFRMWLYPVPCWIAFVGWTWVYIATKPAPVAYGLIVLLAGALVFLAWSATTHRWPFEHNAAPQRPLSH